MRIVVQNLQAEVCAQRHGETRLQEVAIALANTVLADEKHDNRHDGCHRELGDILVVAAFDEALLDGAAVVKDKPVPHEERNHENTDDSYE